jgi:hypothetical protein
MNRILVPLAVVAGLSLGFAGNTDAANLSFLKHTPLHWFTDEDFRLMNEAAAFVLNDQDPLAKREWTNPGNGYSGWAQGGGSFKSDDGLECRKLRIWTQAKGVESNDVYPVCRDSSGRWRLASGKNLTPI